MVIIGLGETPDLEDLSTPRIILQPFTRTLVSIFALLRFMLLLAVTGLTEDARYLLAIAGIGMLQNVIAATAARTSAAHGLHLQEVKVFEEGKVMAGLQKLEVMYPKVGASLVPVFFPGALREEEEIWWKEQTKPQEKH
jgi:hypothetical protein